MELDSFVMKPDNVEDEASSALLDDIASRQSSVKPQIQIDTSGIVLGTITDIGSSDLYVSFAGSPAAHLKALTLCQLTQNDVGKVCAIQFIGHDIYQPIVMGLVNTVSITQQTPAYDTNEKISIIRQGKRIVIEAEDELVLQCGETRIVMSAEGIIQMRAPYIDSQAQATHRLKGGSVQVN